MIKKQIKPFLLAGISALVLTACGGDKDKGKFDKAVLKEDITPEMPKAQKDKLTKLGTTQPVKDLAPQQQQEVAQTVIEYLETINWSAFNKQLCHAMALGQDKCEDERQECIEEMSKISDDELKQELKKKEPKLNDYIKESDIAPADFIAAIELIDYALGAARELDCNSTDEEMSAAEKKVDAALEARFGKAKYEKLSKIAKRFVLEEEPKEEK